MAGSRYSISGRPLPKLVPFLEEEMQLNISDNIGCATSATNGAAEGGVGGGGEGGGGVSASGGGNGGGRLPADVSPPALAEPELSTDSLAALRAALAGGGRLSLGRGERCRHGVGQSLEEVYYLRTAGVSGNQGEARPREEDGGKEELRMPDAVVWPTTEAQVQRLVVTAAKFDLNLIPFGGGTNVSHALRLPPRDIDARPVVSVDLRELKSILSVDEENGVAHVQVC